MKSIRQGDVILIPVKKKLKEATEHKQLTLAYGEVTGHHHTLYPPIEGLIAKELLENDKRYIELEEEWTLRHQEHDEIKIPEGTYEIKIEREYDPFLKKLRRVVD